MKCLHFFAGVFLLSATLSDNVLHAQNVSFSPSKYRIKGLEKSIKDEGFNLSKSQKIQTKIYLYDTLTGEIADEKVVEQTISGFSMDTLQARLTRRTRAEIDSVVMAAINSITEAGDRKMRADSLARHIQTQNEIRRQAIIGIEQRYSMLMQAYDDAVKTPRRTLFLPALNSSQSINFYLEKDTISSKFFASNSLVYNSSLQKLTFANETYSDFFGPVRFGVGFLISSSSNSSDTTQAKDDAVQKIAANGGNVYTSFGLPFLNFTEIPFISIKSSLYTNIGVDVPKDSIQSNAYGLMTTSGVNLSIYSQGFLRVVQLFYTGKVFYVGGNRNFEQRLGLNNYWMMQNSLGLAINDKFRLRVDAYSGLGKQNEKTFIRSSFPVTISFDIVNPF